MPRDSDDLMGDSEPKMSLWERFRYAIVDPDSDPKDAAPEDTRSKEELEEAIRYADDKERGIGLIAAPAGALIALLVTGALINHAKSLHQSTSTYQTLTFVLLGITLVMLGTAWFRKRLILGLSTAMFGLAIFNLHYWGFGVPFVMVGAWLLVRGYRLQQKLKMATSDEGGFRGASGAPSPPRASKRYTPPPSGGRKRR
ncbi:MAG TPA: hypothetical protein VNG12_26680 [Acidimicrobiales bacterium]|nr:hypothetical protein [Acidimicrobiales bacterium]